MKLTLIFTAGIGLLCSAMAQQVDWKKLPASPPRTIESLAAQFLQEPTVLTKLHVSSTQISHSRMRSLFSAVTTGYRLGSEGSETGFMDFLTGASKPLIPWTGLTLDQQIQLRRIVLQKDPNQALLVAEVQSRLQLSAQQKAKIKAEQDRLDREEWQKMGPIMVAKFSKMAEFMPKGEGDNDSLTADQFDSYIKTLEGKLLEWDNEAIFHRNDTPETKIRPSFKKILTSVQLAKFRRLQKSI